MIPTIVNTIYDQKIVIQIRSITKVFLFYNQNKPTSCYSLNLGNISIGGSKKTLTTLNISIYKNQSIRLIYFIALAIT